MSVTSCLQNRGASAVISLTYFLCVWRPLDRAKLMTLGIRHTWLCCQFMWQHVAQSASRALLSHDRSASRAEKIVWACFESSCSPTSVLLECW